MDDLAVQVLHRSRTGGEDRRAAAAQRLQRAESELDADICAANVSDADDEIGDRDTVRIEKCLEVVRGRRDEYTGRRGDRRNRRAASVEDDEVRVERTRQLRAGCDVGLRHRPG